MKRKRKHIKSVIIFLIMTVVISASMMPTMAFAIGDDSNKLLSITLKNKTTGSLYYASAGDKIEIELNPSSANGDLFTWYVNGKEKNTGKNTYTVESSDGFQFITCEVTDALDSSNVVRSNTIYVYPQGSKLIEADKIKVGDVLTKDCNITMRSLEGKGWDYVCLNSHKDYKTLIFHDVKGTISVGYDKEDVVVVEATPYTKEKGVYPGEEFDGKYKGKSVLKIMVAPYKPYNVTHNLNYITATADTSGEKKAVNKISYTTTLTAADGYILPDTISLTIGGKDALLGTDYTYDKSTGTITVIGDKIEGDIIIVATAKHNSHIFSEWIKENDESHIHTCHCGEVERQLHNWNSGEITTEPTTTSHGVKTYTCIDCKATKMETIIKLDVVEESTDIPKTGDDSNIMTWCGALLLSLGGLITLSLIRKKTVK